MSDRQIENETVVFVQPLLLTNTGTRRTGTCLNMFFRVTEMLSVTFRVMNKT